MKGFEVFNIPAKMGYSFICYMKTAWLIIKEINSKKVYLDKFNERVWSELKLLSLLLKFLISLAVICWLLSWIKNTLTWGWIYSEKSREILWSDLICTKFALKLIIFFFIFLFSMYFLTKIKMFLFTLLFNCQFQRL